MRLLLCTISVVLLVVLLPLNSYAIQSPPKRTSAAALQYAIKLLTQEAEQAKSEEKLPRQTANFYREFKKSENVEINSKMVWEKIRRPLSKDPFIDSYIRWQLTGFNPTMPDADDFEDSDFENFLNSLPQLLGNPRSDRNTLAKINQALGREQVSDEDAEKLNEMDKEIRNKSNQVNNLNKPGIQLRNWVDKQVGNKGHRIHQARLERLAAMVKTGWNAERHKRTIAQGFENSKRDYSLTPEMRRRIAEQAQQLVGLRTAILTRVSVNEGIATAQFDEAAVYDFEVREWVRSLAGK